MVCAMPVTSFNGPAGLCMLPVAALCRANMFMVCLAADEMEQRRSKKKTFHLDEIRVGDQQAAVSGSIEACHLVPVGTMD